MALKKRIELKTRFANGLRPSEQDFADVIDSAFNKRDDQFFGRWRPGTVYRKGDVVIHKRTLWERQGDQDLCSHTPPEPGPDWKSLIVPMGDEDWLVIGDLEEPGVTPVVMYANEAVDCIGIGTLHPRARLDVVEAGKSRFLLGPKAAACTAFTLVNLQSGQEKTYLLTGLDEDAVSWVSDVPGGFAFRHGPASDEDAHDHLGCRDGDLLMVVQPDTGGLVRVGIGTDKPEAMLDVTDTRRGRFLFNPEDKQDPAFTIVKLDAEGDPNYLASGVGAKTAVFVTDAPDGFVFKQGGAYGDFLNEENINQGRTLVSIAPEGTVGVGREPADYQLDVNGLIRAYALYLDTDRNNIARPAGPGPLLDQVMRLRPVRFEWRVATGFADEGEQLGLIAQEVEEVLPQVVRTSEDGTKAVAYPNLVAVVIKAVQEQQALIAQQQQEIAQQQAINARQQEQIDQQQQVNADQQEQIDQQQAVNAQQQEQIDQQQAVNVRQQEEIDRQQGQVDGLSERVAALQQQLGEQQEVNEKQARILDDHAARIERLEQQLADQPDVSELVEQIAAQQEINAKQQEQIDALERRLEDQPDVSELLRQIDQQQAVNARQQEEIKQQQAVNARQQEQLGEQQKAIEALQEQIKEILQRLEDGGPPRPPNG